MFTDQTHVCDARMPSDIQEAFGRFYRSLKRAERNALILGLACDAPDLVQEYTQTPSFAFPESRCESADLFGYGTMKDNDATVKEVIRRVQEIRERMRDESDPFDQAFFDLERWWRTTPRPLAG